MKNWNGEASMTFRLWLTVKAGDLREAVLSGETTEDDIVLSIADDLERMAMGGIKADDRQQCGTVCAQFM